MEWERTCWVLGQILRTSFSHLWMKARSKFCTINQHTLIVRENNPSLNMGPIKVLYQNLNNNRERKWHDSQKILYTFMFVTATKHRQSNYFSFFFVFILHFFLFFLKGKKLFPCFLFLFFLVSYIFYMFEFQILSSFSYLPNKKLYWLVTTMHFILFESILLMSYAIERKWNKDYDWFMLWQSWQ